MITCKICNMSLKNNSSVSAHLRYNHPEISIKWYNDTHVRKRCESCSIILSKKCNGEKCNKRRDRTGSNNPFYGKSHSKEAIDIIKTKTSIKSKIMWEDPIYREKVTSNVSKPRIERFKKEQSDRIKQWYNDNPIQRQIRSNKMAESWKEAKIKPSKAATSNESKGEISLREECIKLLPLHNVTKCTIHLNGKWYIPDILINDNHIIEYFGDYWHANPNKFDHTDLFKNGLTAAEVWKHDIDRISSLESHGYKVMVIWQSEYKADKNGVLKNILNWINDI